MCKRSFTKNKEKLNQSEIRSHSFIFKKHSQDNLNLSQDNCKTPLIDFKFQKPKDTYLPNLISTFQSNAKRIAEKWHRINSDECYRKHLTYSLSPQSKDLNNVDQNIDTERSQELKERLIMNPPQSLSQRRNLLK